jgi:hypothetical protein
LNKFPETDFTVDDYNLETVRIIKFRLSFFKGSEANVGNEVEVVFVSPHPLAEHNRFVSSYSASIFPSSGLTNGSF